MNLKRHVEYAFGGLGAVYLVCAALLGLKFLTEVVRVVRATTDWSRHAWRLYKFSLLYLALLFAAMVLDRAMLTGLFS